MTFRFNALLQFKDNATQGLSKAQKGFQSLGNQIQKANASINKIGQGLRGATLATAPIAAGIGFVTNEAMQFEAQMSTVQSVLLATTDEMKPLNAITKQLGATTSFTAEQAGQGAEALARAGFSTKDIVSSLSGVLDAAAASGVGLGEAADVVANQIGAFGLQAKDATRVADTLALTTSLTNTDFTALAEGMKFAGATAKQAGLSLEETASSVGVLANAGVKGSLAGTALKNALLQLSKPSKEALDLFGGKQGMDKALFRMVDGVKKLRPMEEIMGNISIATSKAKDPLEAVKQAASILGLRGTTAMGAFSGQIQKTTVISNKNLEALRLGAKKTGTEIDLEMGKSIPTLLALRLQIAGAEGSAKKMAKIKLDNLKGAFTLLGSAVSGVSIEVGSLLTGPLKGLIQQSTDFLSVVATGFQLLNAEGDEAKALLKGLEENQFKHLIGSMKEFASGFIEGFEEIKATAISVFESIREFIKPILGDSNLTAKEIGKIVAKVIAVGAALAPVFAGMLAFGIVIGPILTGISGLFGLISSSVGILLGIVKFAISIIGTIIGGISLPVLAIIGAITAVGTAIYFFRDEIISVLKPVGEFIFNALTWPFKMAFEFISGMISKIVNTTLGSKALELAGVDVKALKKDLETPFETKLATAFDFSGPEKTITPTAPIEENVKRNNLRLVKSSANEFATENVKLQKESLKQNVITQPPSAQQNASAMQQVIKPVENKSSSSDVNVNLNGQFKLRGSDLLLSVSKSKVENSERNGRTLDPITKRRMVQNGDSV